MDPSSLGVQKKILHAGRNPPGAPQPLDYPKETKFFFHYQIRKVDSEHTVLDDTKKYGKTMELYSGKEFQIKIWEMCLETMLEGEVSSFTVETQHLQNFAPVNKKLRDYMLNKHEHGTSHHCCGMMAMKDQGGLGYCDLDEIMANPQPLEFIFEIVKIDFPGDCRKESWIMSGEEKLGLLPKLKEEGNSFYVQSKYKEAADKYGEALGILEQLVLREKPGEPEWIELDVAKIPFYLNLSQCKLNMKEYYPTIEYTTEVLQREPDNVKALFRRAKAHMAVWNVEDAKADFKKAAEHNPALAATVAKELTELDRLCKEKLSEEKEQFKGIFA